MKISVRLDQEAVDTLARIALAERRSPADQAAYLLERQLTALRNKGTRRVPMEVADASTPRS